MKMRIEERPALEAYIGKRGHICLKMESAHDEDTVIPIPPEDVEQVIDWLKTLAEERMRVPDHEFEDDEESSSEEEEWCSNSPSASSQE